MLEIGYAPAWKCERKKMEAPGVAVKLSTRMEVRGRSPLKAVA